MVAGPGRPPCSPGCGRGPQDGPPLHRRWYRIGLARNGDESQLSDEVMGQVCQAVRPSRPDGHGAAWTALLAEEQRIKDWVADDLNVTKIHILLGRQGVEVPYRTLSASPSSAAGRAGPS